MRRIIVNPSGDEEKKFIQDMVIDFVLGALAFLGVLLITGSVLRYLVGNPLLDPSNLLLTCLGAATLATMISIHRETAMPGEGRFWMTRRTPVGTFFHCLVYGYALFLTGTAFDIPYFRRIPLWVYDFVSGLL